MTLHEDFDDLFSGQSKRMKISDADILETKEVALDRISGSEAMFLCTRAPAETKMQIVWLAPVRIKDALYILEGVDAFQAVQPLEDQIAAAGEAFHHGFVLVLGPGEGLHPGPLGDG